MFNFMKKKIVITRIANNTRAGRDRIRKAIADGFSAVWDGTKWVLTKIVYGWFV